VAVLSSASLFGDWQATLDERSDYPHAAASYPDLRPGELPGVTLPQFSQLTEHTARIAENLAGITDRLDRAISQETADEFSAAVRNVNRATKELADFLEEQRTAFTTFSGDMRVAGENVRTASDALQASLARIDSATGEGRLQGLMTDARASAANLREVTAQWRDVGGRLDSTLTRADSAMAAVQVILGRVERGEGSLGLLTADTVLYENTASAIEELRALLDELKRNPERYFRFSIF
jgi:phospholipid/cholesterol/gamma-HCH transport system substrate-binding protein